ncbi:hypothetical protein CDL12_12426 [Handroanthus impetiginosus]|uniref:Uncharacterized protein n=1 Tax=Handroanthus impetiginosus TaxID=429701 RepID=A0A2G9HBQ1_9LAMI|nr:hypothetical protein CDL12_12426 [Handroanthus impetiginosus]
MEKISCLNTHCPNLIKYAIFNFPIFSRLLLNRQLERWRVFPFATHSTLMLFFGFQVVDNPNQIDSPTQLEGSTT